MQSHKIVICEDHDLTSDGLRVLISSHPEFVVVGHCRNSNDLMPLIEETSPHILILDLNLGHEDGFSILEKLRPAYANLRVLILTMFDDDHLVEKSKRLRANGYLVKSASSQELIEALHGVLRVNFYESPLAHQHRMNGSKKREDFIEKMKLTKRETEIIRLVAKGKTPEEISTELFLSLHTVRTHKKNILKKLDLPSTADLVRFAYENKLV